MSRFRIFGGSGLVGSRLSATVSALGLNGTANVGGVANTPTAPVLTSAQEGGDFDFSTQFVRVTVGAPASDGGSAVIDYDVKFYGSNDNGVTYTVLEQTLTPTTTGLVNMTLGNIFAKEHQVQVRARNANGYGATATATCTGTIAGGV